jgi:hypothetical protein
LPDHGPKLHFERGVYHFTRRLNGRVEAFFSGPSSWFPADAGTGFPDAPSALRALAKATGWEIKVEQDGYTLGGALAYRVVSGRYLLRSDGVWDQAVWFATTKPVAEALARDCDARGHYPAELCDRGEV